MILNESTSWSYLRLKSPNANGGYIQFADADDDDVGQIFYYHGSGGDYMSFTTNASEAMRIDSSGNVGIGTSSPSSYDSRSNNLVVGDSGDAGITIFSGATSNARLQFAPSGSTGLDNGLIDYDNNDDSMAFATGGSERMRIDSNGNIAIGGTSASNFSGYVTLDLRDTTGGLIDFSEVSAGVFARIQAVVNNSLSINNRQAYPVTFGTNDTERMRIDGSGLVGIGCTPSAYTTEIQATSGGNALKLRGRSASENAGWLVWTNNADSVQAGMYATSNNLIFANTTGFTERMRIDSSGNLLVGTTNTNPAENNTTGASILGGGDGRLLVCVDNNEVAQFNRKTTDGTILVFRQNAVARGSVSISGANTSYNTTSDARLKDVTGEARGLEVINELNPVAYNWKESGQADEGLIAQEVMDIVPNAVSGSEEEMYQMDYSKLVVHLVAGMKEQQAQIEALQSEINLLKGE